MSFGKRKKNVLDEDQYLDDLEYIIKRDFFPDSELIELQLKYYDALDAQDFVAIKEIQLKLNKINQSFSSGTSLVEDTPASISHEKPYKNPNIREERDLHLEQYLSRNTSEDNYSYSDLQQKAVDRQLKRLAGAFIAAKEYNEERFRLIKPASDIKAIEYNKNAAIDNGPDMSTFMEYKVFNPVFFNPDSAPLSKQERITLAGKKSEVVYENTRFKMPLYSSKKTAKSSNKSTLNNIPGKIGPDGKEIYDGSTPRIGGYSVLSRSLTPYLMTPGMTWGEIDGTPQSIPDSPIMSQFKMQGPSERETIANDLASRSSRKNKENKEQALQRVRSNLIGSSYRSRLTPSGARLFAKMTPYTPGMIGRPGSSVLSNMKATPISRLRKATPTPNLGNSITDNLLDI